MNLSFPLQQKIKKLPFISVLTDISRHIRHPLQQEAVWRDFLITYEDAAFIRRATFPRNEKVVLFIPASGMIYEAKLFSMLATGLKMLGWTPKVLLSKTYTWSRRYFEAFGINDVFFWEDAELSSEEKTLCEESTQTFHTKSLTIQSVKKWTYREALMGPQIISTISRSVMQGAPDLADPSIQHALFSILPITLQTVHKAEHILDTINPQIAVVVEANYAFMGALVDTAIHKGINVIQMVQPSRDDALIPKRLTRITRRYHPNSVSLETLHSLKDFQWSDSEEKILQQEFQNRYGGKWFLQSRNQPNTKAKGRDQIIRELNLDPHKKTAVIFSHILWDANLFYGDDLFEDYGDWFVQTVEAARKNRHVNWLVKLHPANLWKRAREYTEGEFSEITLIRQFIGDLPSHVKLLYPETDISTWSLFEFADFGVTVRGTIGMELPCLGVPVFTAGTGRYSGLGFTNDSQTKEEYLEKLAHIQEFPRMRPEEVLLAKRYAFIAFRLRPWEIKSFAAEFNYLKKGNHPLDSNFRLVARSFDEIRKNRDLEKWAVWAEDPSKGVDYLDTSGLPSSLE